MATSIFNSTDQGSAIKLLKNILRFKNGLQIVGEFTAAEIIAGVPSPVGSHAIAKDNGELYIKEGALDTEWISYLDYVVKYLGTISKDPHGFVDPEDTIDMSWDDGTRTFSIFPKAPATEFVFYNNGVKFTKTALESIVIDDTEGEWFGYYDSTGTLQKSQIESNAYAKTSVYTTAMYWDATNSTFAYKAMEYHSTRWPQGVWAHIHNRFGTAYVSGLSPQNIVADGNGSSDTHAQIGLEGGSIDDEDLRHTISDGSPQDLDPILMAPFWYREGVANWRKLPATGYVVAPTGSGRAAYNLDTAGVWSLDEVGQLDFVLMHLYDTNDALEPVSWVLGQTSYTTLGQARDGAVVEVNNLKTGGLPFEEWIPVATFIIQTSDGYANAVKSRIRTTDTGDDFINWRGQGISPAGAATSHDALQNLTTSLSHLQYWATVGRDTDLILYFGSQDTNGSWRAGTDQAGNFFIQERVAGNWLDRFTLP